MNWQNVSVVANCVVAIMAIIGFVFGSKKYKKLQSEFLKLQTEFLKLQTDFAAGQAEIAIRNMISNARNNYLNIVKECSDKSKELTNELSKASLEDWLNAYDEACAKYLDNKIDKGRFKKMYASEIRQVVEDENTKSYYDGASTRYWATKTVYTEWYNPEM